MLTAENSLFSWVGFKLCAQTNNLFPFTLSVITVSDLSTERRSVISMFEFKPIPNEVRYACGACDVVLIDTNCLLVRIANHDLVLEDFTSYPVPGTTNENHKNISVRTAGLWVKFLNLGPHEYEAEVLTPQSHSAKYV
jgi:hypothetical protein